MSTTRRHVEGLVRDRRASTSAERNGVRTCGRPPPTDSLRSSGGYGTYSIDRTISSAKSSYLSKNCGESSPLMRTVSTKSSPSGHVVPSEMHKEALQSKRWVRTRTEPSLLIEES